jgi:hypothetical protein
VIIEILGIGDARSDELEAAVREALEPGFRDAGVTVLRFDDPARMIARGVRRVPGLVVGGEVVCRGRVPNAAEVREWVAAAAQKAGGPPG